MNDLLQRYARLLEEIDSWFSGCLAARPDDVRCHLGCSGCCRGLFDITLLDALLLQQGVALLNENFQHQLRSRAHERLLELRRSWPEFDQPFLLNYRPEEDWEALMPDDDETPCLLLDSRGRCRVYDHRPMTCRLHGLPLVDVSGEVMHNEWCSENFTALDPLRLPELRGEFDRFIREEVRLGRELSQRLFGRIHYELDTLIPTALLLEPAILTPERNADETTVEEH